MRALKIQLNTQEFLFKSYNVLLYKSYNFSSNCHYFSDVLLYNNHQVFSISTSPNTGVVCYEFSFTVMVSYLFLVY